VVPLPEFFNLGSKPRAQGVPLPDFFELGFTIVPYPRIGIGFLRFTDGCSTVNQGGIPS
jgi:hypothetical protein